MFASGGFNDIINFVSRGYHARLADSCMRFGAYTFSLRTFSTTKLAMFGMIKLDAPFLNA